MAVKFQIDATFTITGRGAFVAAKVINHEKSFYVPKSSTLGGLEIKDYISQPRAVNGKGKIRLNIYIFQLKFKREIDQITVGNIVELIPGDTLKFLPPWIEIDSKGSLEKELQKEVLESHPLFGQKVKAIAKREDNDDVLFQLENEKIAMVHLTWRSSKELSSKYPRSIIYEHWSKVFEEQIVKDNQEFERMK